MKVVIVEDEGLLLDALADGFAIRSVEVSGRARTPKEAIEAVDRSVPEVVLLDIRLPPSYTDEGLSVAEEVHRKHPDIGVLVLSSYAEVAYAERLLSMRANSRAVGYLLKERVGNLDELVAVLHRIAAGEVIIDAQIIDRLMARRRSRDPLDRLSPHERRILAMVAEGRSNLGIAQQLSCQVSTVEKHVSAIADKLGLPAASDTGRPQVNVRVLATLAFLRSTQRE